MITYSELRNTFDYRDGKLFWKVRRSKINVGDIAGCLNRDGYWQIKVNYELYKRSRLIWLYHHGYMSENNIDHINRIRDDDRIENLREVNSQCNLRNTGNFKHNISGVKGVSWSNEKSRWHSQIMVNRKSNHLGYFDDFNDAVLIRFAAEQCLGWNGCDSNSPAYLYAKENSLIGGSR